MVELNVPLAARTERSTSAEVDLTFELTSLDTATRAICALSALVWILSVVLAVTAPSDRSMSAEIALIWFAASPDVAVSERCASRALPRIEAAVSAASDLTWLAASDDAATSVLCAARAGDHRTGGRGAGRREGPFDVGGQRFDLGGGLSGGRRQCGLRIAGAGQNRVCGTAADRSEGALDFRRGHLELRADVGGNRQQRLLRGARAGLNGLAGVDHQVCQRAFRILHVGLDPKRQFLGPRHQIIAGLASAALDAARHGFDA